jgi:Tfp pilus assembly PilM family ATPase
VDERREKIEVAPPQPTAEQAMPLLAAGLQAQWPPIAPAQAAAPAAAAPVAQPAKTLDPLTQQIRAVEQACREPLTKLIEELDLCRRYYESTFPSKPVERLVFIGGEARQRTLCQHIAQQLGLAAQVGDPLTRMGRISEVGIESGIDRRQPQPGWTVAIGLSLGPVGAQQASPAKAAIARE